ncbi:MAG: extracellular solute-binding protein, partial [Ilumatobacteraceae bacterium]|nr:extracellular solute-binding protein [Ilumatobacteraceae bacterium]
MATKHTNARRRTVVAGAIALALTAAACGSDKQESSATTAAAGSATSAIPADLIAAAKAEGTVNLIALPDDWANYKGILAAFTKDYGVKTTVASPDASSADEL